jgi:hypothetical protein
MELAKVSSSSISVIYHPKNFNNCRMLKGNIYIYIYFKIHDCMGPFTIKGAKSLVDCNENNTSTTLKN